jgi:hypothetical protein
MSASIIHAIATPKKPDKKLLPEVLPIGNAAKNAITATIHQGRNNPARKDNMSMIKKSTVLFNY